MNKSFCALPWLHIHTFPSGKVFPCCVADKKLPIGNLNDNTIDEIIHSSAMNDIRAKMLKGENVENCMQSCTAHENTKNTSNNFSKRNTINKFYEKIIPDLIELTNEDGSFKNKDDFQMKHLNIRFSNLCNFKFSEFLLSRISASLYNLSTSNFISLSDKVFLFLEKELLLVFRSSSITCDLILCRFSLCNLSCISKLVSLLFCASSCDF